MDEPHQTILPADFRRVLGHYPTGVCAVTATGSDGAPVGIIVGSFSSVSLSPPLVGFFPARSSTTWPLIEAAGRFCVNVLSADQIELCTRLSASGGDKFASVSHTQTRGGSPLIDGIVAWIDCALHAVHDAGDHFIVLGRVIDLAVTGPEQPLLFFRGSYGRFSKD